MFELLEPQVGIGRRILTLSISVILHGVVIAALVVIPLIYYNILPKPEILTFLAEPPAPPPPPPPPAPPARVYHFTEHIAHYYAPTQIPKTIPPPTQEQPVFDSQVWQGVPGGVPGGVAGGVIGGVSGGTLGGVLGIKAPSNMSPPPPPPKAEPVRPIRVGGDLQAAKLVFKVDPEYPRLARQARVEGLVIMQVTVDEQGKVTNVQVLRGHPLLVNAAVNAVKQWRYKPTYLNGHAVPVIATVTVTFALSSSS